MNRQLIAVPLRDCGMRLHRRRGVALGRESDIDAVRSFAHCMDEIALPDGFVFLFLGLDCVRRQRRAIVGAVFHCQVLGGIARLFEGFRDHECDRLPPVANRARRLLRGFVGSALRRARGQARIVYDRDDPGHAEDAVLVDFQDFAARDRRCGKDAFDAAFDRVFGRIGRRTGNLGEAFDTRNRLPDHALLHPVEAVRGVGFVLLEMHRHAASSTAWASTAWSVRRASGILKSFSP